MAVLTSDCLTPCSIDLSIDEITAADDPGVHASEENPNTLNFTRGDAQANGTVNIVDAMYIAQYTVGLRSFTALNALNAASTKHDTGGDILNIVDAMYIAQYTVSLRDENFNSN